MILKVIFSTVLIILLPACSSSYKELNQGKFNSDDLFIKTIVNEYKEKADFEALKMHDWNSAKLYSEKALKSINGEVIEPQKINYWKIDNEKSSELKKAYDSLMIIYKDGIKKDPINLAKAIVSLDCWAEQEEEGWQKDHIENCRSNFLKSMHSIYNNIKTKEDLKNIIDNKDKATIIQTDKDNLIEKIIYFDFDDFILNSENILELNNYINQNKNEKYYVIGHADTKGSKKYNYELSLKRANSIKKFIVNLGINSNNIKIIAKGEDDLAIPTPDDTPHPANRRAVIKPTY